MTSGNNSSSFDINNLYNEVLTKFLHAKDIFVAKEMARLDEENKALNEETEELKVKLGYIGPLFVPPLNKSNDLPINTPHTNKSQLVYKNQETSTKYNVPTTKNNEDIVHKSKQSKKSESTQIVRTDGDRVGDEIDVGRLDFRVGRIIQAKKHPDADSLYVEEIDIGEDRPRTVVSGLVRFIPLEEMQDRLVVCLCNLKPAKMRGIESQAMVMCASTPEKVELLEIDPDCKPGDIIMCESFSHRPDLPFLNPKKKIWEAIAPELSVSATGECVYKGHQLRVFRNGSALKARTLINVPVK